MTPAALYAATMREKGRFALPWRWLTRDQQNLWRIRAEVRFGKPKGARAVIRDFILNNLSSPQEGCGECAVSSFLKRAPKPCSGAAIAPSAINAAQSGGSCPLGAVAHPVSPDQHEGVSSAGKAANRV